MALERSYRTASADIARRVGVAAVADAAEIPSAPGAYLILIELDAPVPLAISTLPDATLRPGLYLYAGSARGPGGLRARVARHLRRGKPRHWHIDHLTETASELSAYPIRGGCECALVKMLTATGRCETPVPGFGSSDCRICASHLLVWRE